MSSDITKPKPDGTYPAEPKVVAGTAATYLTTLVITALMTIVQDDNATLLIGFLPEAVEPFVLALLPAALAYLAGYQAKHQHRRTGPTLPPTERAYGE